MRFRRFQYIHYVGSVAKSAFYGTSSPCFTCGVCIHLSQVSFLTTIVGSELHPHRSVLESSSPLWVGKLVKWRLVYTYPGGGSDSGRSRSQQPVGNTGQRSGCVWSHPSPVPRLPCQAPWGGTSFRSLCAEPLAVRGAGRRGGRAGRRGGDTARPAEGGHLGKRPGSP